jgi:hypothetical protein
MIPTKALKAHLRSCKPKEGSTAGMSLDDGSSSGGAQREMLVNCEAKLSEAALLRLREALVAPAVDIELIKMLWDVCRGLNVGDAAGKVHTECVTEVMTKKAKQAIVQIKLLHNMSNMKISNSSTPLRVSSASDEQPHVTAISALISEVSQMMIDVVDCGLKGPIALACLKSLHAILVENLVSLIGMFTTDRNMKGQLEAASAVLNRKGSKGRGTPPPTSYSSRPGGPPPNASSPAKPVKPEDEDALTAAIDLLLDETAIICQLCERYTRHINQTYIEIGGDSAPGKGPLPIEQTQVLLGNYLELEEAYLNHQVAKAFEIEETCEVEPHVPVSSMAEDTFFILQKVFTRSVATLNVLSPNVTVNHISAVLDGVYREALVMHLKNASSASTRQDDIDSAFFEAIEGVDAFTMKTIQALNTVSLSASYVCQLRDKVGEAFKMAFPEVSSRIDPSCRYTMLLYVFRLPSLCPTELFTTRIKSLISQTSFLLCDCIYFCSEMSNTSTQYIKLRDDTMKKLLQRGFSSTMTVKLRKKMSALDYVLTLEMQTARENNDPFMDSYVMEEIIHNPTLTRCKQSFLLDNFVLMMKYLSESIATAVESEIMTKKYNEMGSLQVQKEVRVLIEGMSSLLETGSVRPAFARVNHALYLLTLSSPKDREVFPYPKPVLEPAEIQKVLGLRVDFAK